MNETEAFGYYFIVFSIWSEFLWGVYLVRRQCKHLEYSYEIPFELTAVLSQETFEKSRIYTLENNKLEFKYRIFNFIVNIAVLFYQGLPFGWEISGNIIERLGLEPGEILRTAAFTVVMNLFTLVCRLPFSLYKHFVLEERHGFNKLTLPFYFWDRLKRHIFQQLIFIPLMCGIVFIVRISGQFFFIYIWMFAFGLSLFLYTIFPIFIAPIFDKYKPLPEGLLKEQIENLANSVGFSGSKIFIIEGSKRSTHSNAFIFGVFKAKRIILYDTLLKDLIPEKSKSEGDEKIGDVKETEVEAKEEEIVEEYVEEVQEQGRINENKLKGCDTNEVLAIIAHELGHWKYMHIAKRIAALQAIFLVILFVFNQMYQYKTLYEAFGFQDTMPVIMGMILVSQFVCTPFLAIISYFMTQYIRRCEVEADAFAKQLGRGEHLKSALIKLNADNLGFPYYDYWYSLWNNSHPPLLERIQFLDKTE